MCGRAYSTYTEEELEARYHSERMKRHPLGIKPNYNMAPTHVVPVILNRGKGPEIDFFRWGLVPKWARDVKTAEKYSLINAKGEEITEKRSYAEPFKARRLIVPLSGFFEWKRDGKIKRPFAIHLKDQKIMSVAGVWEEWRSKDGEVIDSFSIITISANSYMEEIHNRMPVILDAKDEARWMNPENSDIKALQDLLKSCPSERLKAYEVSTLVNSPKNNSEEALEPVG